MKPERIRRAQIEGNTEYLSAAGKKGARILKFKREEAAAHEEIWEEVKVDAAAFEEADRMKTTNENALSLEGEDVEKQKL